MLRSQFYKDDMCRRQLHPHPAP